MSRALEVRFLNSTRKPPSTSVLATRTAFAKPSLSRSAFQILLISFLGECLETLRSRNHPILEIGELNIKDRQDIVTTLLSLHNKRLDSNQMKMLFSKKDVTEPLYLVVVCQELRLHGVYEKLDAKINEIAPRYTTHVPPPSGIRFHPLVSLVLLVAANRFLSPFFCFCTTASFSYLWLLVWLDC